MPCRCRTSRAGGRKAGSRSCCGYVGCYISGAQAPPRRTGAGNGFCPPMLVHGQKKLWEKTKTSFFPSGPTHEPCLSPTRVWTASPWLSASATLPPAQPPSRRWRESSSPEAGPVSWNLGRKDAYLARHLQFLSEKDIACRRQAFRRSRCLCLPRQEHHRIPSADALSDEMRAAGFKRIYHIPLCSGIVCLHVAEKG